MGARERGGRPLAVALLAGLLPLLQAPSASAEPFQVAGGGVFVGYSLGERGGFEWGIEGFATHHFEHHPDCGDQTNRHGVGPLLRLSVVKVSRLEVTVAGHGGGEITRSLFAVDGELGASLFVEKNHTRVAPHTGVTLESIMFNLYFRQEWLEPSYSVGGGARFLPTFGEPGFCEF